MSGAYGSCDTIVLHFQYVYSYVSISPTFFNILLLPGVSCSALWLLIFALFLKRPWVSSKLAGPPDSWFVEEQSW